MSILNGTHVGFTGTKIGMTDHQMTRLRGVLTTIKETQSGPHWLHHGDCVGSDQQAHMIARRLSFSIYLHPPISDNHRAFCDWDERDVIMDYLVRDDEIARWSRYALIATPSQSREVMRSGTWTTVRYALKRDRRVMVIPPYGMEFRYTESIL